MTSEDILNKNVLLVKVFLSKKANNIVGYEKGVLLVELHARPIENEANIELLKFLKKTFKKNYVILSGHKSRVKKVSAL